jgi:DNA-binding FadR family transcriptional regulator
MSDRNKPIGSSEFLKYLANHAAGTEGRIPPLSVLSHELGVSVAALREQLEVARALGLVAVSPKKGIHRLSYTFRPAVVQSLNYAIGVQPDYFFDFAELRKNLEISYWYQAVGLLNGDDREYLSQLISSAEKKLSHHPIQVPQREHRELHLTIYRRLGNVFVTGILEAYWDAYEAFGLHLYNAQPYLLAVWQFHKKMVEEIRAENYAAGYNIFLEHVELINLRKVTSNNQNFE